jgi:hypothetical protein
MSKLKEAIGELSIPVTSAEHFRGLFLKNFRNLQIACFKELLKNYELYTYNNKFWTRYQENINTNLQSKEKFVCELDLPLNLQLKNLLYSIASIIVTKPTNWNVGLFWCEEKGASLGSHFDDDEVYTIQVIGEKEWVIDGSNADYLKELISSKRVKPISAENSFSSSETWIKNHKKELRFFNPKRIIMKPGDLLVTPAYALHKVTSISDADNLSINVGITRRDNFSV